MDNLDELAIISLQNSTEDVSILKGAQSSLEGVYDKIMKFRDSYHLRLWTSEESTIINLFQPLNQMFSKLDQLIINRSEPNEQFNRSVPQYVLDDSGFHLYWELAEKYKIRRGKDLFIKSSKEIVDQDDEDYGWFSPLEYHHISFVIKSKNHLWYCFLKYTDFHDEQTFEGDNLEVHLTFNPSRSLDALLLEDFVKKMPTQLILTKRGIN
jgi:hypothetical protein